MIISDLNTLEAVKNEKENSLSGGVSASFGGVTTAEGLLVELSGTINSGDPIVFDVDLAPALIEFDVFAV